MSIVIAAAVAAFFASEPPQSRGLPGAVARGAAPTNQPRPDMRQYVDQFERDLADRNRREQHEAGLAAAQRERAVRLAAMANAGQCPQAIQIARDEGDVAMAERLTAACSRISTTAPTTTPPQ
jgi:hypothetical protein